MDERTQSGFRQTLSSLGFQIPLLFLVMLLVMIGAFLLVMQNYGSPLLRELAIKQVRQTGESIVSVLGERLALTSSLVTNMANVAETLDRDVALHHKTFKPLIDYEGIEHFIAGGGVWPEPYQFDQKIKRRSFFWGRDGSNQLQYFDDYNDPSGAGYHYEEWYVPGRYLEPGQVYWSKSYMDPYSYQSMVTATAPMVVDGQFYGVTTVDIKLEGLSELLEEESKKFGGYAYAVDRNGTFLSYPNDEIAKRITLDEKGNEEVSYLNISDVANANPDIPDISRYLTESNRLSKLDQSMAQRANLISSNSYQVDLEEAHRIVSIIIDPLKHKTFGQTFISSLEFSRDPILNEAVLINVFHVPKTYWRVVTVTPESVVTATSDSIIDAVLTSFLYVCVIGLLIGLIMLHVMLLRPLRRMQDQVEGAANSTGLIEGIEGGELGMLASRFNNRSQQLLEAKKRLEESVDSVEQAAIAKSQFLANMSHEIRTPMNGVIGMLDLLELSDLNGQQSHYTDVAKNSAESLLALINDILDFSKIEAGKLDLESIDFNVMDLLSDFVSTMAPLAEKKGLQLVLDMSEVKYEWVKGDPNRFRQIFTNLVSNAIKFTDEGEVLVQVGVRDAGELGVVMHAAVADTGIGIPSGKQKILFDSFAQVDASTTRQYGGTGLGLAICKQLCELMDGSISVRSEIGAGSRFELTLNMKRSEAIEREDRAIDLSGHRILVVDENTAVCKVLHRTISSWGGEVYIAQSVEQANRYLLNQSLSLVMVDINLPSQSGLKLLKQLSDDRNFSDIKSVAITTFLNEENEDYYYGIGASGYVVKPILPDALIQLFSKVFAIEANSREKVSKVKGLIEDQSQNNNRILLVEDNPINQEVAEELLKQLGYRVDVAENGKVAIDKLQSADGLFDYNLIIMDCQMPEMDGYQATRQIRSQDGNRAYSDIPIIAMTANAMKGDKEKCLEAGMNDYISKPIDVALLKDKVSQWIDS